MTILLGNNSNINAALAASLLFHLVVFGVISAVRSTVQPSAIKEYLPVELVQMPSPPRAAVRVPVAAAPQPVKAPAPAIQKERPASPPPPIAQTAAPLTQPHNDAPSTAQSLPVRTGVIPGNGAVGKAQPVSTAPPSRPTTGAPQPQKRDKGSYLAFHRLTKLPSFKSRSEPVYPNAERMTGSEARVLAEIYLDERGVVDDVTIKKSGGRLFDKAVIDAVRQSNFHPGYMGEKAVPTVIQIPYTFKLK